MLEAQRRMMDAALSSLPAALATARADVVVLDTSEFYVTSLGSGCVVHEPGSTGYAQATRLWNGTVNRKPALVTACSNTNDVRAALLAAPAAGLPVSVRNGGQDWVGRAATKGRILTLDITKHDFY